MKVIQGHLNIEGSILYLYMHDPHDKIVIKPDSTIEINLGSCWIEGTFQPDYKNSQPGEPFDLMCMNASFCGLRSGMLARILVK